MPTFVNSPLLWGLAVVAAPVIIHLINLLRHRRVRWAAMEFLLASQKKHSTWIRLKELLLLLLRMAAVAAVVLIVARPRLDGGLGKSLGDVTTHHIVLLDDSFSMSDRYGDRNVFDAAKEAVKQIAADALEQSSPQTFTVLRTSRAAAEGGAQPDFYAETVNTTFYVKDATGPRLNALLERLLPSDSAAGPEIGLRALSSILKPNDTEERIVYVLSDFRAKDWRESEEVRGTLIGMEKNVADVYLVNCADEQRSNLAVTALRPESGTRAAGINFYMQFEVRNFGDKATEKVAVEIRTDGDEGGGVILDPIEPGRSATGRFSVFFSQPGEHLVSVQLGSDAVDADNRRYTVVNLTGNAPVLVVNDAADTSVGGDVALALAPPGKVTSGVAPEIVLPTYLNDAETNPLGRFAAVYVANVQRLDPPAVRNLEEYVRGGGGLLFIAGNRTDAEFARTQLYRGGEGLLPVPLDGEKQLFRDREANAFDILVSSHQIFKRFFDERNPFFRTVTVNRYFGVDAAWTPEVAARQKAAVIATLRNGAPLVVEKPLGKGRVAVLLTTPAPPWTDWKRNPSFPLTMLETQTYLASFRSDAADVRRVGAPLVEVIDPKTYVAEAEVLAPGLGESAGVTLQAIAAPEGSKIEFGDTARAGIYRIQLTRVDKTTEVRHYAVNTDAGEGDLARIDEKQLRESLGGAKFQFRSSDRVQPDSSESSASLLSTALLYGLVVLLIGEQALAYSASYHPPLGAARGGAVAAGGSR
jgi:hypothetical protein